jgi:SulP family sulfate permease
MNKKNLGGDITGGVVAALNSIALVVLPMIVYGSLLGPVALSAALWASIIAAIVAPLLRLALRASPMLIVTPRAASVATYAGLIVQLSVVNLPAVGGPARVDLEHLLVGLAAGSMMFAAASVLVLMAGWFNLGNLFKMIPTPVSAGVSNGTALLLAWLAVLKLSQGPWTATLTAIGMLLVVRFFPKLQQRIARLRSLPTIVVAIAAGLALALWLEPAIVSTSLSQGRPLWGWTALTLWPELHGEAPRRLLLIAIPGAVTLALIMILETFTSAATMESRFGVRSSARRELIALGGANLAASLLGGAPSTGAPGPSAFSWLAGGRSVVAALVCILLTGAMLVVLGPVLVVLPAGLLAGLLLMQAQILADPVFFGRIKAVFVTRRWRRPDSRDLGFWITLTITLIGFLGTLIWACFMGIGLSCMVVLRRLAGNLTARWSDLSQYRSRRVRSGSEGESLTRMARRVGVLRLTGHLFFGNSARLTQLADELPLEARAVVIDVSQVQDVDTSGADALAGLIKALIRSERTVMLCGLQSTRAIVLQIGLVDIPGASYRADLDRGLEACEDELLMAATLISTPMHAAALADNALLLDLSPQDVTDVMMLGEARKLDKGDVLFRQHDVADGIWLLEQGGVSVLAGAGEGSMRLATFGPGQFVGEMGLIDGLPRSATARADSPVHALLLDSQAIKALEERHPALALTMTRNIARELSFRVRNASAMRVAETASDQPAWANSISGSNSGFSRY